jgi:hypothetical protein
VTRERTAEAIKAAAVDVWGETVLAARRRITDAGMAHVANPHQLRAYGEIAKLGDNVPAWDVVEVVAALVLLQLREPYRFESDRAFWQQITRRVRALDDMNAAQRYSPTRERVERTYKDFPARASIWLGRTLAVALGAIGHEINERDLRAEAGLERAQQRVREAMRSKPEAA